MTMRDYPAEFCSETPFTGRRYAYNRETERYEIRLFEARLQVTPEKMFADVGSPNGIQMLWQHGSWSDFGPSLGRVTEMEFKGKALVGMVALSEEDVLQFRSGRAGRSGGRDYARFIGRYDLPRQSARDDGRWARARVRSRTNSRMRRCGSLKSA